MMKKNRWLLFFIISTVIILGIYYSNKELLLYAICLFIIFVLPVTIYLFLDDNKLDINKITINNIDDKTFRFSYDDIVYEISREEFFKKPRIPRYDSNNKKVNLITRDFIKMFLYKNYTVDEVKDEIEFISNEQVMDKVGGFKVCDDETRGDLAKSLYDSKHHIFFIVVVLIIFLLSLKPLIYNIQHGYFDDVKGLWIVIVFVGLLILSYLIQRNSRNKTKSATIYYRTMYVYEKKKREYEDGVSYYFRIWDKKKHVLYQWFSVSEIQYEKELGTPVTVYVIDIPKEREIILRFIDEKKED